MNKYIHQCLNGVPISETNTSNTYFAFNFSIVCYHEFKLNLSWNTSIMHTFVLSRHYGDQIRTTNSIEPPNFNICNRNSAFYFPISLITLKDPCFFTFYHFNLQVDICAIYCLMFNNPPLIKDFYIIQLQIRKCLTEQFLLSLKLSLWNCKLKKTFFFQWCKLI